MKILHLDSSILGDASASRTLSAAIVEELHFRFPEATVTTRDLVSSPIHIWMDRLHQASGQLERRL